MPVTARGLQPLRLFLSNTFGLLYKFGAFQHTVHNNKADIAIVTETKFSPQGGGVAVWVRDTLPYEHLDTIDCHGHEVAWLRLHQLNGEKLVVCAV